MIQVKDLSVKLGHFELHNVNMVIQSGNYGVLMGKTGCGKTTVLEAICGLRHVRNGNITLCGLDVTNLKPAERCIGFVPQEGSIFTTMSVRKNIGFALSIRRWSRKEIDRRVNEIAEAVGITHLLKRMPHGLSGGERQRIALARALAFQPDVLCLDEPLSALDYDTRSDMCDLLKTIVKEMNVTALHITHNRNEAARLADQIFLFEDGQIVETPRKNFIVDTLRKNMLEDEKHEFVGDL
jgi:molybdate/tungstate transport system ATP-binding protein